jgi:hypothetical protein
MIATQLRLTDQNASDRITIPDHGRTTTNRRRA